MSRLERLLDSDPKGLNEFHIIFQLKFIWFMSNFFCFKIKNKICSFCFDELLNRNLLYARSPVQVPSYLFDFFFFYSRKPTLKFVPISDYIINLRFDFRKSRYSSEAYHSLTHCLSSLTNNRSLILIHQTNSQDSLSAVTPFKMSYLCATANILQLKYFIYITMAGIQAIQAPS